MSEQNSNDLQSRTAYQIAIIGSIAIFVADGLYLFLALTQPSWQMTVNFLDTSVLLAAAIASIFIARQGDITRAMLILIFTTQVAFLIGAATVTNLGLAYGLGIGFLTAMVASPTLPSKHIVTTAWTAALSGILCVLMDTLAPSYRLVAPPTVKIAMPALVTAVCIIFSFFLISQYQTTLRAKLMLGFTIMFLVAGFFAAIAIQQQYRATQQAVISETTDVVQSVALSVGRYPGSAVDFVAHLYQSQHHPVEIVDTQLRIIAAPVNSGEIFKHYSYDPGNEVADTLKDGQTRLFTGTNSEGQTNLNMMVVPVKDTGGKIIGAAIIDYTNISRSLEGSTNATAQNLVLLGVSGLLIAFAVIQFIATVIVDPIILLRNVALDVGRGQLNVTIPEQPSEDEIGTLSKSFKNMATQLRGFVETLEQRVSERTSDLAAANQQVSHRAAQLEAIAKVTRSIASVHDLEIILPQIAQTISEEFGFYHVGIFLIDETKQFTVLKAANSAGGQIMLQRGHQLKIGEQGIVGYVAANLVPRIALDTGADAVFFNNPDLPTTRSEMALPLLLNEQIIGVLDVQSQEPSAFHQEDIEVLSTLAGQVSIAIQNARLFEETSRSLREARTLYEQYIRGALSQSVEQEKVGYRFTGTNLVPLGTPIENPEIEAAYSKGKKVMRSAGIGRNEATLTIPIKLRDNVIGVLDIRSPNKADWDEDDVDIAEAIAGRVALAVENAALLEDSQRRASKERIIGEVTSKIGQSINLRNVLQTAAEELGRVIPGSDVIIQFQSDGETVNQEKGSL
jgi:GAF domain-containing protein/HAMP domain-containing protein